MVKVIYIEYTTIIIFLILINSYVNHVNYFIDAISNDITNNNNNNADNRNLKYYNGDRHFELLPLYNSGNNHNVVRRLLTHTPTKRPSIHSKPRPKPTKSFTRKPSSRPVQRKPTSRPTKKSFPTPSRNNSFFTFPATYKLSSSLSSPSSSSSSYITIDSNAQLTLFENTKCSPLPYYITDNFIIILTIGAGTLKTSQGVVELALFNTNTSVSFTRSNIKKTCRNPEFHGTFKDIKSLFNIGDIYMSIDNDGALSLTRTSADELVITEHVEENDALVCYTSKRSILGPLFYWIAKLRVL